MWTRDCIWESCESFEQEDKEEVENQFGIDERIISGFNQEDESVYAMFEEQQSDQEGIDGF